ncbi:hypothetical protein NBH19_22460 [Rhizobium sp. S95]|uniref:Lipoprotein n=1 Tax=Ciceribacter sichuanensis TaxID=2949647 RepID=A0AAJ1F6P6_9HYPH|nr:MULTISPECIES: hypothetical protein [unclassified Ciceribacter]MCM2398847.1 hypothetical protein [Ciceribacter sp. S95]MCO5956947.1 hypothetical protein [Ciceribacter sp. S101]
MKLRLATAAAFAIVLSGCTTTEEANTVIQSRWVGQPVEVFFTQYGPPVSEFPMASGNVLYTWRGGDKTRYIAPTYSTPTPAQTTTRTETKETKPGVTVTKTTTTGIYQPQPQMISPPRYEELFCELQITADPSQRIVAIRASNDTDGEGLSFSRCAEVLNAHPQR